MLRRSIESALAAAARVPFYGISYDPKVKGFCRDASALELPTTFDIGVLEAAILSNKQPNWEAVEAMKARARASFAWALEPVSHGR